MAQQKQADAKKQVVNKPKQARPVSDVEGLGLETLTPAGATAAQTFLNLPNHSTTQPLQHTTLLRLQKQQGNRYVQRFIAQHKRKQVLASQTKSTSLPSSLRPPSAKSSVKEPDEAPEKEGEDPLASLQKLSTPAPPPPPEDDDKPNTPAKKHLVHKNGSEPEGVCPTCGQQGQGKCKDCGESFAPSSRLEDGSPQLPETKQEPLGEITEPPLSSDTDTIAQEVLDKENDFSTVYEQDQYVGNSRVENNAPTTSPLPKTGRTLQDVWKRVGKPPDVNNVVSLPAGKTPTTALNTHWQTAQNSLVSQPTEPNKPQPPLPIGKLPPTQPQQHNPARPVSHQKQANSKSPPTHQPLASPTNGKDEHIQRTPAGIQRTSLDDLMPDWVTDALDALKGDASANEDTLQTEETNQTTTLETERDSAASEIEIDGTTKGDSITSEGETQATQIDTDGLTEGDKLATESQAEGEELASTAQTQSTELSAETEAYGQKLKTETQTTSATLEADAQAKGKELEAEAATQDAELQQSAETKAQEVNTATETAVSSLESEADTTITQLETDYATVETDAQAEAQSAETEAQTEIDSYEQEADAQASVLGQAIEFVYADELDLLQRIDTRAHELCQTYQGRAQEFVTKLDQEVVNPIQEDLSSGWKVLEEEANEAWQGFLDWADPAIQTLNQAWEGLKSQAQAVWDDLMVLGTALSKTVSFILEQAIEAVQKGWDKLSQWAGQAWAVVEAGVQALQDLIVQKAEEAKQWITEKAETARLWMADKAEAAQAWIAEKAEAARQWVADKAETARLWVSDKAETARLWLADKAGSARSWIADRTESANSWIEGRSEAVTAMVGGLADNARGWISGRANTTTTWIQTRGTELITSLSAKAQTFVNNISSRGGPILKWFASIVNSTISSLEGVGQSVVNTLSNASSQALSWVENKATGAINFVEQTATGAINLTSQKATGAVTSVSSQGTTAINRIEQFANTGVTALETTINGSINLVEQKANSGISLVEQTATSATTWVETNATNAITLLENSTIGLITFAQEFPQNALGFLRESWSFLQTVFKESWTAVKEAWPSIQQFLTNISQGIRDTILFIPRKINEYLIQPLRQALQDEWNNFKAWLAESFPGLLHCWEVFQEYATATATYLNDKFTELFDWFHSLPLWLQAIVIGGSSVFGMWFVALDTWYRIPSEYRGLLLSATGVVLTIILAFIPIVGDGLDIIIELGKFLTGQGGSTAILLLAVLGLIADLGWLNGPIPDPVDGANLGLGALKGIVKTLDGPALEALERLVRDAATNVDELSTLINKLQTLGQYDNILLALPTQSSAFIKLLDLSPSQLDELNQLPFNELVKKLDNGEAFVDTLSQFVYSPEVRKKMDANPSDLYHNFPSLLDNMIISEVPILIRPDGRQEFIIKGIINSSDGAYHMTLGSDGQTIIHRVFIPQARWNAFAKRNGLPLWDNLP